jgi:CBS domain containing-hemolysin-like protein
MIDTIRLAGWRDAAVALLSVQALLLGLLPLAALYWAVRGVTRLQRWLRPALFQCRMVLWRYTRLVRQGTERVAASFVWLHSASAGLQRFASRLCRR